MDNIGEVGKFILLFYPGIFPVVGQFVSGFLSGHPLLYPLFASPRSFPVFTRPVYTL